MIYIRRIVKGKSEMQNSVVIFYVYWKKSIAIKRCDFFGVFLIAVYKLFLIMK